MATTQEKNEALEREQREAFLATVRENTKVMRGLLDAVRDLAQAIREGRSAPPV